MRIRVASRAERTDPETGEVFASKAELVRWYELKRLEKAGAITQLRRQVKFPLTVNGRPVLIRSAGFPAGRQAKYTADFVYRDIAHATHWPVPETIEDSKGFATDAARLRMAVVEAQYGVRILITGSNHLPKKRGR